MLAGTGHDSPTASPLRTRPSPALRIEWLCQMVASLAWIISVFSYGLSSSGDWLQLLAASSWMAANVATLSNTRESKRPVSTHRAPVSSQDA